MLTLKRILAFIIDYFIIITYAGLLFLSVWTIFSVLDKPIPTLGPVVGNILGLVTMTIPTFIYFYVFEIGKKQGTIGKQLVNLKVTAKSSSDIFKRLIMKLLPWEIGHVGVHWFIYYESMATQVPIWLWTINIIPQVMVVGYFVSMLLTKGTQTIYDQLAGTQIESYKPTI